MGSIFLHSLNTIKGSIVLSMVILASNATIIKAQSMRNSQYRYMGVEVNFGAKATKLSSDLSAINNMDIMEEGGSVGFVLGNQFIKARAQAAGFYYSSSSVKQTVNMVESALQFNIYPLKLINKSRQAINPYISGGVDYSTMKFFGYYHPEAVQQKINYSSSEPFLGKIVATRGTIGAGIEWRLPQMNDFVHLFAEARYAWGISQTADALFKNTKASNSTSISMGVSFGILR